MLANIICFPLVKRLCESWSCRVWIHSVWTHCSNLYR